MEPEAPGIVRKFASSLHEGHQKTLALLRGTFTEGFDAVIGSPVISAHGVLRYFCPTSSVAQNQPTLFHESEIVHGGIVPLLSLM